MLQELKGALAAAQTKLEEVTAAAADRAVAVTDLQASTPGGRGLMVIAHMLYIAIAVLVVACDSLTKAARRLG